MRLRVLIATSLAAPVAMTGALALRSSPGIDECEDGPVPVVWPLGPTGFDPMPLLSSHGQFLQFSTGSAYVHEGLDVAACVGDKVYAVEDGTVVDILDDGDKGYGYLIIRDSDSPEFGWAYVHLADIAVDESEDKRDVLRGQFLGSVADFPAATGFNHLHLERVQAQEGKSVLDVTDDESERSADDPLNWLVPRTDGSPPRRLPFGSPHPAAAGFLFFEVGSDTPLAPHELDGKDVEIVGRVSELFPGVTSPACSPIAAACAGPATMEITPRRISFGVFFEREDPSGLAIPRKRIERVFHNVIDLSLSVRDIDDPAWATATTADRIALADHVYHDDSKGDYSERYFLIQLTHCRIDGSGSFRFAEPGEYLLQVVLEDWSGNVDMFERTVVIP